MITLYGRELKDRWHLLVRCGKGRFWLAKGKIFTKAEIDAIDQSELQAIANHYNGVVAMDNVSEFMVIDLCKA